jgi:hypothetical protein
MELNACDLLADVPAHTTTYAGTILEIAIRLPSFGFSLGEVPVRAIESGSPPVTGTNIISVSFDSTRVRSSNLASAVAHGVERSRSNFVRQVLEHERDQRGGHSEMVLQQPRGEFVDRPCESTLREQFRTRLGREQSRES